MPRKKRTFPISYLFPNIITLAGLCMGLSAVRFAMLDRWELSAGFLIIAAIIDGMDGRLARMLNATSTFGANLDSLADFVSFGVAPVLVMYLWQLHGVRGLGWLVVLFFAVCMCLRLARFNTSIFDPKDKDKDADEPDSYFTGVPAPAGAMLCILPMVVSFQFGEELYPLVAGYERWLPHMCVAYVAVIAIMLISTLPTFSAKKFKIRSTMAAPFMVLSGVIIAGFIIETWLTFIFCAALYLLLIPYSLLKANQEESAE